MGNGERFFDGGGIFMRVASSLLWPLNRRSRRGVVSSSAMNDKGWPIDLKGVRKTYNKKIHALRGVDIRVGRGEIFGLLGPNGAGKSTLVKIITTVVLADRAEGTILGRPLGHKPTLGRIGYLPEDHRFPHYLTGNKVLDFYARLSRVPAALRRENCPVWASTTPRARSSAP